MVAWFYTQFNDITAPHGSVFMGFENVTDLRKKEPTNSRNYNTPRKCQQMLTNWLMTMP